MAHQYAIHRRYLLIGASFTYLLFLNALILFHGFGGDGRGRFGGVVLLHVSGGSGDGSPSLARTKPNGDTTD